jgi:signal transduction histidine kinase
MRVLNVEDEHELAAVIARVLDRSGFALDVTSTAARDIERLFERFARGQHDGDEHGTGLGLAVVGGIVHAHGGTVRAAPWRRGGLDLTIRLPARIPVTCCAAGRRVSSSLLLHRGRVAALNSLRT